MRNTSTKIKILSLGALLLFTFLSIVGAFFALRVTTDYSLDQFLPPKHALLTWDKESKKVFHITGGSPHIVLLTLKKSSGAHWYDTTKLEKLQKITQQIGALKSVKTVISLGNIQSAFEKNNDLLVSNLNDLRKEGFDVQNILKDPLYTPNLISKDGLHTAIFVSPNSLSQDEHRALMRQLQNTARQVAPEADIQVGGPAGIRTQIVDLLSHEIFIFILLSLICAIVVIKIMFHGLGVLPQMIFILVIPNTIVLGLMGKFHITFNILLSTLPIIVTITALGIASHTLVRMGEAAQLDFPARLAFLKKLMRELLAPHLLTALTTAVGFGTLMSSHVPLISDYGKVVAAGVLIAALCTLVLVPCLYLWVKWPVPRQFLHDSEKFSYFLVHNARTLVPGIGIAVLVFFAVGTQLSWTARLFDDLPAGHASHRSTDLMSRKLGGISSLEFAVGTSQGREPWKDPANLERLKKVAGQWRRDAQVGSVVTLADFMATGEDKKTLPRKREGVAELEFLYGMSGESPLRQFLSSDDRWTRLQVRLPDLPANEDRLVIKRMKSELQTQFPQMEVRVAGLAATVPLINDDLSSELMWGFFESMFWIVLLLALAFRSLRWALVAVIPNLVPPTLLLGFLAIFHVPIKPGIAIIFSISLGLAFCNTVYVLERLKHMLKSSSRRLTLPVYSLMKKETMPCLVSSLSLFAGFSIFLFSVFPVNKLFGVFMLISIAAGLLGDLVWLPVLLRRFPWLLLDSKEGEFMNRFSIKWQTAAKVSPYVILLALGLVAFRSAYAAEDVQSILKSVESKGSPPNEREDIQMVISESDGSKKIRELSILRKNEGGARAMIRLQKPSDLKGLSLLTVINGGKEEQYLYLPSDKKSRRLLGSNKKGKFLGSEIAYEDLALSTYKQFNNKVVKDDGKTIQIESKAKPDSDSSYAKVVTWISKADHLVQHIDYYDKSNKLLKKAQFKGYEKVGDRFWRARDVQVQNVQENRQTHLIVQKVSLKKIDDDEVSLSAMEE